MTNSLIEELRKLGVSEFELASLKKMLKDGNVEVETSYDPETNEATIIFKEI